jgi:hypothetical protein
MDANDPPIIVTGGSVSIEFDNDQLQGNNGRYNNEHKKIKRVEVTGDGINFAESTPNGKVIIKIYYGNP